MNLNSLKKTYLKDARRLSIPVDKTTDLVPVGPWVFEGAPPFSAQMRSWRELAHTAFFYQAKPSESEFRDHLNSRVIADGNRILFAISHEGKFGGHLGISEALGNQANLDNVMRSPERLWPREPPLMEESIRSLASWAFDCLAVTQLRLEVRSDNGRAIALYTRCGFQQIQELPLRLVNEGSFQNYIESSPENSNTKLLKLVFERSSNPPSTAQETELSKKAD